MPTCQFVLTPAESKRLIARAVLQMKEVKHILQEGIMVIPTGSTNAYLVEELLGEDFDRQTYLSGITIPANRQRGDFIRSQPHPDVVLREGRLDPDLDRLSALQHMKPGDIYVKGANALNYERQVAGVLIGGFGGGGTIGGSWGHIVGRRLNLIIPVGLEKTTACKVEDVAARLNRPRAHDSDVPRMMPVRGTIITEIEALDIMAGVQAFHIASGGIGGAEGAVRLLVEGTEKQLCGAKGAVDAVKGEKPFWPVDPEGGAGGTFWPAQR